MNAKSRAAFINSIVEGQMVVCPNCGLSNQPDNRFCISCGTGLLRPSPEAAAVIAPLTAADMPQEEAAEVMIPAAAHTSAFSPIEDTAPSQRQMPTQDKKPARESIQYKEPSAVFAQGLPDWDVLPPQIMVKRR